MPSEIYLAINLALCDADIEIPFPQHDLHVKTSVRQIIRTTYPVTAPFVVIRLVRTQSEGGLVSEVEHDGNMYKSPLLRLSIL